MNLLRGLNSWVQGAECDMVRLLNTSGWSKEAREAPICFPMSDLRRPGAMPYHLLGSSTSVGCSEFGASSKTCAPVSGRNRATSDRVPEGTGKCGRDFR